MEEQSEIVRSKKEFAFASSTILSQVGRGIIVGLIVGIIVGSFRFLIEKGFHLIQGVYQDQGYLVRNLFVLVLFYILICWLSAKLTRSDLCCRRSLSPFFALFLGLNSSSQHRSKLCVSTHVRFDTSIGYAR